MVRQYSRDNHSNRHEATILGCLLEARLHHRAQEDGKRRYGAAEILRGARSRGRRVGLGQLYPLQSRPNGAINRLLRCLCLDLAYFGVHSGHSLLQVPAFGPILHVLPNGAFNGDTNDSEPIKFPLLEVQDSISVRLWSNKLEFLLRLAHCTSIPILHLQLPLFLHRTSPQLLRA